MNSSIHWIQCLLVCYNCVCVTTAHLCWVVARKVLSLIFWEVTVKLKGLIIYYFTKRLAARRFKCEQNEGVWRFTHLFQDTSVWHRIGLGHNLILSLLSFRSETTHYFTAVKLLNFILNGFFSEFSDFLFKVQTSSLTLTQGNNNALINIFSRLYMRVNFLI